MKKILKNWGPSLLLMALVLVPAMAHGQNFGESAPVVATSVNDFFIWFCRIINLAFTLLIILAILFVIYAAFLYLTGGGSEDKASKANSQLIYAVVAVIVAILAKSIPIIIGSFFQQTVTGCAFFG